MVEFCNENGPAKSEEGEDSSIRWIFRSLKCYLHADGLLGAQAGTQSSNNANSSAVIRPNAASIDNTSTQTLIAGKAVLVNELGSQVAVGSARDATEVKADCMHRQCCDPSERFLRNIVLQNEMNE